MERGIDTAMIRRVLGPYQHHGCELCSSGTGAHCDRYYALHEQNSADAREWSALVKGAVAKYDDVSREEAVILALCDVIEASDGG